MRLDRLLGHAELARDHLVRPGRGRSATSTSRSRGVSGLAAPRRRARPRAPAPDHRGVQQRAAAVHGADRADQVLRLDVLEQVAGGAGAHRREHLVVVDEAGEHDDARARVVLRACARSPRCRRRRGITRSISTTSGLSRSTACTASTPSAASPTTSMSSWRSRKVRSPCAHDRVVVGDQHADHRGTSSVTVVPVAGPRLDASVPPSARARSSIDVSPSRRERSPGRPGRSRRRRRRPSRLSRPSRPCSAHARCGSASAWRSALLQRLLGDAQHLAVAPAARLGGRPRPAARPRAPCTRCSTSTCLRSVAASPSLSAAGGRSSKISERSSSSASRASSCRRRSCACSASVGIALEQRRRRLGGQHDAEQLLRDRVVQLARQPVALLDDAQLAAALEQAGVLDGDGGVRGEHLDQPLVTRR